MREEGREREEEGDDERGAEPGRRGQEKIGGERIRLSVIVSRCRTRGNSLTAEGRRQRGGREEERWRLGAITAEREMERYRVRERGKTLQKNRED